MNPHRIQLKDIDRIEVSYWLSYADEHYAIYDVNISLKPEAYFKPGPEQYYQVEKIYWSAYQPQLDHCRYTGCFRDCSKIITPNGDQLEIIDMDTGRYTIIDLPLELLQAVVRRAKRAWEKTDQKPGTCGKGVLQLTERHLRFFSPNLQVIWTDEAREVYARNEALAKGCIDRLITMSTHASRNQNDPVELRIYRDRPETESFYWVESKPKENRRLMTGGVIRHGDEYGIHT